VNKTFSNNCFYRIFNDTSTINNNTTNHNNIKSTINNWFNQLSRKRNRAWKT